MNWYTGMHRQVGSLLKASQTSKIAQEQRWLESKRNMQRRALHLAHACRMLRQNKTKQFKNNTNVYLYNKMPVKLTHSDRFKLIGCKLPKVASTNIKTIMYGLDHLPFTNDVNKIDKAVAYRWQIIPKELNHSQMTELKWKLSTYTKFIFVRDPIERLVSAYRDNRPHFLRSEKVSFNDWLVKVIFNSTKARLNRHVTPFSEWCQPCSTTYDFVGQMNNFDDDINAILEHVGARDLIILPKRGLTGYTEAKSYDVADDYRSNIPRHLLEQIYEKYYIDYILFGFPRPY